MQAHVRWVLAALLLVIPGVLLGAEPKAVIDGEKLSRPGDLVVLRTTGSVGTGFAWNIVPASAKKHCYLADGGKTCIFATRTEGKFTFVLSVTAVDTDAIGTCMHELVNSEDGTIPDDEEEEEEEEEEDPVTPESQWAKWARITAEKLVDMPCGGPRANAAKAIAAAIDSAVSVGEKSSLDLSECREIMAQKTSAAVSADVQRKWNGFSVEMDREIRKIDGLTKAQWLKVMASISDGLKKVR